MMEAPPVWTGGAFFDVLLQAAGEVKILESLQGDLLLFEKPDNPPHPLKIFAQGGEGGPEVGTLHMDNDSVFLTGNVEGNSVGRDFVLLQKGLLP